MLSAVVGDLVESGCSTPQGHQRRLSTPASRPSSTSAGECGELSWPLCVRQARPSAVTVDGSRLTPVWSHTTAAHLEVVCCGSAHLCALRCSESMVSQALACAALLQKFWCTVVAA